MSNQDLFEKDYLAAFPFVYPADIRQMEECNSAGFVRTKTLWLQQAKRHEAEKAELVAALAGLLDAEAVLIPPYEAGIDAQHSWALSRATARDTARAAIAKYEVRS